MKNILISILAIIIVALTVTLVVKDRTEIVENSAPVATTSVATTGVTATSTNNPKMVVASTTTTLTASTAAEGDAYENGVYWAKIKGSKIVNGNLVVSVDFLQSFANNKDTVIAAIEDGYCTYDYSDSPYKTKQEFINKVKSLREEQVDEFVSTVNCFPNGIIYFRNASTKLRDKTMSANFIAYPAYADSSNIGYMSSNTRDMQTLNAILNDSTKNYTEWNVILKDNKIQVLTQMFRP